MARKSRETRIQEARTLVEAYEKADLTRDKSFGFMRDMITRMERGKYLTKGQRNYLDNLVDQGLPETHNEDRVKQIREAANADVPARAKATLLDFAHKLNRGWNLSAKQESFLSSLLDQATDANDNGRFRPTTEMKRDLELVAQLCRGKNSWYWQHRQGTAKAYDKVMIWLKWTWEEEARQLSEKYTGEVIESVDEPFVDEWACEKLFKTFAAQIKKIKSPAHEVGSLRWQRHSTVPVLISGTPSVDNSGNIVYPCLVAGELREVASEALLKRRPKG